LKDTYNLEFNTKKTNHYTKYTYCLTKFKFIMKKTFTYLFAMFVMLGAFSGTAMAQSYCTPTYSTGCTVGDMITSFDLNTISETFVCVTPPYYDHTNISTDLTIGETYVLTVSAGYSSTYFTVWIDFDNSYTFDATEVVASGTCTASGTTYTFNLTIPNTVSPTATRMRIRSNFASAATDPCTSYTFGNAIDYSVMILPLSDIDAGVTEVISPEALEDEAASIPVEVVIQNFGTFDMDTTDVYYSLNGGTPVSVMWTGLLAAGEVDTVTMPNITVPPGFNDFCAWTDLVGDTIPQDDSTCITFYGNPLWDAGVTAILEPGALELENTSISPEVIVENFGVNTITSMNIEYIINSGTPVTYAWTGSIATGEIDTVTLPPFIVPGGFDTICAYTVLPMDGDPTNDETCHYFYADPQFDLAGLNFLSPETYCGMGLEDVTVQFINQGDTIYTFDLSYSANGAAAITETVTQTVYPGDTVTYTFNTQIDMTTTLYDVLYNFTVWCEVLNDPLFNNDSIYAEVNSLHIPEDPIPQGDTVVYGNSAQLIAFSIDSVNWYEVDTLGAPIYYTGPIFNTPILLDTTTYYAQASSGILLDIQLGNGTSAYSTTTANPIGQYYTSQQMQFVILASEIQALGFTSGNFNSLAFEVTNPAGAALNNYSISMGATTLSSLTTSSWQSGLQQVYSSPSHVSFNGLNNFEFDDPYYWDGVSNIIVQFCFSNGTSNYTTNGTVTYNSPGYTCGIGYYTDGAFTCGSPSYYYTVTSRPNFYFNVGTMGCASNLIPITAIVTDIPTQDAGIVGLLSPVDGVELSTTETVTCQIYNYGLEPIWNVPVTFTVNGVAGPTEIVPDTIQPYDTFAYTFTATADLSAIQTHNIEVCTSHPLDIYSFNDCMSFPVVCHPLTYCTSEAQYNYYGDIVDVAIGTWNYYSGPATGETYNNYTLTPPVILTPGVTYPIAVTSDFPPTYSYQYNCWVEVYIDWNHDGVFDETTDELVFSQPTLSSNTVTGSFTVPMNALIGTHGMRVVFDQSTTAAEVTPCGSYYYGETEDYVATVLPWIPLDGGVIGFNNPGPIEVANMSIPVEVLVQNYGSDTLTMFDIAVEFNGGTPVITPWTGSIAPGDIENIVVSNIVPVNGTNNICAYTIVTGDTNGANDETCFQFGTSPQFDAYLAELVGPENPGCDLGLEDVTVKIKNLGDTIVGNMVVTIIFDSTTTITDVSTATILPGDSLDFTFGTQFDFTNTTTTDFYYTAYVNLLGDPNQANDTIMGMVESLSVPNPPVGYNDTVPYGSIATLTCTSPAATYWYETETSTNFISADTFWVTPVLYDTVSAWVESSGGALGDFQFGTDNNITGVYDYPSPYSTWYYGNKNQFLILAEEMIAMGMGAGPINSVAFNSISTIPTNQPLTNFYIKMGHTNVTGLNGWQTGLTQVWSDPSWLDVAGWNTHNFTTPFMWDGVSNVVIETCFNNSGYTSGSQVEYSIVPFNGSYNYHADQSTVCSSTTSNSSNYSWRPNMIINGMGPGCPSNRVEVIGYPTGIPAYDAGVTAILEPMPYGIDMSNAEPVTVTIHNWGLNPIANFQINYQIDNLPVVTEIVPAVMLSGDTYDYTFNAPADLSAYAYYDICAWTSVLNDGWSANDTTCLMVQNDSVHYCDSYATGTYGEDIVNVTVGGWSNSSASALGGYQNFYNITPATLTMNNNYPISISSDFAPGSTYAYTCYVEVYIDFNHDNQFTEPDELVFGALTNSQNTVTGTIFIPNGSYIGEVGMRVVLNGVTLASQVTPCGTYYHGETEDYMVELGPQIPYDAGVISIIQPLNNAMENYPSPVEVLVQNFGSEILTSFDIEYSVDGGTPVVYNWTGSLAQGAVDNYFLPNLVIPGGFYDLCAYTVVTGDNNTFNDQTCINLYGIPQFEAEMLEITEPEGGCDLTFEDVTVVVHNIADTVPIGNMTVSYSANGATPVTETINDSIFPGDTVVYTFATQLDMTVTVDTDFEIFAWVDLVGDPNQPDDTTDVTVISYLTPVDPTPVNQTIWSGTSASLTVTPIDTNLNYFWYDTIGGTLLNNGPVYNTPTLFDTTSYQVQASSATFGDVYIGTGTSNISGTSNNPYGQFYTSNSSQFIITAQELIAAGFSAGAINSLALDVTQATYATTAGYNMDNYTISMGHTTDATISSSWYTGLTQVFFAPQWPTVVGWNNHEFQDAFQWDGISNVVVEFCFSNYYGTYSYTVNANINGTDVGYQVGHGYYTDGAFTCGAPGTAYMYNTNIRPNMKLNVMIPGCSANIVEVFANVQYADYDAAVWAVTEPVTGAYLSLVDVTAHVYNNGLYALTDIPISYTWNGVFQAADTVVGTLNPGDDILFTFTQQLNVDTLWGQHTVCVTTSYPNDGYTLNDESCHTFTNMDGDGLSCVSAFQYGWVNDPPVISETTSAGDVEWWSVEAPGDVNNAYFTLCNSAFDTKLDVYSSCSSYSLWYNDDNYSACGTYGPSHIDVSLLSAGTYYVKVSGYSNYFGVYELEIGGDMPCISLDGVVTDVSCNGQADGSIDLTVTNVLGTLPFSYSWSTGDITEDIFGLAAGTYCVTVSDASNCVETACFTITEPTAINLSTTGTFVSVFGGQDGSIDLSVTGGSAPYSYLWSNGATTEDLTNIYAGAYTVTVTDANGCMTMTTQLIHSPYPAGLPPVPTTITHEIDIPSNATVTLDGNPVAYGSLLIVYYDSAGTMVPGGYAYWSGMASTLIAYGADGTNPGFATGEYFTWKLYDAATVDYYTGTVTYNTQYNDLDQFVANGSSGIWGAEFLSIFTQNVQMPLGWSIWSTYINPLAPDIQDILAPVVSNIIIVKSGTGLVYWPIYGLDNINNIIIGQGYQVKTSLATVAEFVGYPVEPQITPLDLPNGWSILGYLRQTPMAIVPIMSNQGMVNPPFSPPGILIIAKDDEGNIYWPQYGLDGIITMDPGEGYQIKLGLPSGQTSFTFTYPSNSQPTGSSSKVEAPKPVKYDNKVNTGNNMTIGIPENAWNTTPEVGDEVGVFNAAGELVGATVYTGGHTAITVWGDDDLTEKVDGAVENTALSLRYFDAASSTEQVIEVQKWESGNGMYAVNDIAVVGKLTISKTDSYALYQNMPNPFNATTEIKFYLPEAAQVTITVYNVLGDLMEEVVSRSFEAGDHTVQFDANDLPSGNYFYKMTANDFVSTKPMHIVK
jgi:hypothetical protein